MYDHELDRFKTEIHFLHFAADRYGYRRDARESSRASHVLRHPITDDKIVVRLNPDGHWVYFSVRDSRDNGTIVDFVLARGHGRSLGEVRRELRQWLGVSRPDRDEWRRPEVAARAPERRAVAQAFDAARVTDSCPYLSARGLGTKTLSAERFAGTFRVDPRGNVLFAHRDEAGELTGFEVKNHGFTGFSPGGTKSAWQSRACQNDRALVITESAIDALSYDALHPEEGLRSRYLSTAGAPSARQWALLDRIFVSLLEHVTIIAAVDRDAAGSTLAAKLEHLAERHPHLGFRRHAPDLEKDWNDVLQRCVRERAPSRAVDARNRARGRGRER